MRTEIPLNWTVSTPETRAQEEITRLREQVWVLRGALETVADEEKVYLGHGDYEIKPLCSAAEAQLLARKALATRRT